MQSTARHRSVLVYLGFASMALLSACGDETSSYSSSKGSESPYVTEARHDPTGGQAARSNGLSGRFEGSSGGQSLVVELSESDSLIEGTIDGVAVRGIKRGSTANGDFLTPDGTVDFGDWAVAAVSGGIYVAMTLVNLETGESYEVPTVHCSAARSPAVQQHGSQAIAGNLDSKLIGAWRHTHVYGSGEFSGVVEDELWLNADGTYREGGNAAVGDSNNSMITGPGPGVSGRWMTQDRVLYVMPTGSNTWQMWSAYVCDGPRMLFKFSKSHSKIWQRM